MRDLRRIIVITLFWAFVLALITVPLVLKAMYGS